MSKGVVVYGVMGNCHFLYSCAQINNCNTIQLIDDWQLLVNHYHYGFVITPVARIRFRTVLRIISMTAACVSPRRERYLYLILNYLEKLMAAVSLRLPDDVTQRLAHLAELTGRSKTFYMVEAIREHIDDLEDLYLAEQRLIDIRAGKTKTVPLEEVMKRYGLEG